MRKKRKRLIVWINGYGKFKIGMIMLLLMLMGYIFSYQLPAATTTTHWTMPLSGKVIAIDAGHGGPDGGAESKSGISEKDINLAISMYLRDYLQEAGALVYLTRESDRDLAQPNTQGLSKRKTEDLIKRVELVNKSHAEALISIHLNSYPSARYYGPQTFYHPRSPDNKAMAVFIQEELKSNVVQTNRQPKTEQSFYLLKTLQIPAVLVEAGFLSNPEETKRLSSKVYQKKVASAIYRGLLRYYSGEKIETS